MQSTKENLNRPVEETGRPFQTAITLQSLNGHSSSFAGFTLTGHLSPRTVVCKMLFWWANNRTLHSSTDLVLKDYSRPDNAGELETMMMYCFSSIHMLNSVASDESWTEKVLVLPLLMVSGLFCVNQNDWFVIFYR